MERRSQDEKTRKWEVLKISMGWDFSVRLEQENRWEYKYSELGWRQCWQHTTCSGRKCQPTQGSVSTKNKITNNSRLRTDWLKREWALFCYSQPAASFQLWGASVGCVVYYIKREIFVVGNCQYGVKVYDFIVHWNGIKKGQKCHKKNPK